MLDYSVKGMSLSGGPANFEARQEQVQFGITPESTDLASPVEILLGAFAACVLKNVERFSSILKFSYESASIEVIGKREDRKPLIVAIEYKLSIRSDDERLNLDLLKKNISRHGTIYNTLSKTTSISGKIDRF